MDNSCPCLRAGPFVESRQARAACRECFVEETEVE